MIRRISKGGLTHLLLFLSSIISLEIYAQTFGQRFLETGVASRPGSHVIWSTGSPRVAFPVCFSLYRQSSIWKCMPKSLVNVFSKLAMFQGLDQIHMIRRISKGVLTHLLFFLSSIISLEICAQVVAQRFLETGDAPRPGINSI